MTTALQSLRERHLAHRHPCCWFTGSFDGAECGLWCGHDGDHTPRMVGAYLRPRLLTPLDLLPLQRRAPIRWLHCPCCGNPLESLSCERVAADRKLIAECEKVLAVDGWEYDDAPSLAETTIRLIAEGYGRTEMT